MMLPAVRDASERIVSTFEWKIPIWQACLTEGNNTQSPSFEFWDATWNLECKYYSEYDSLGIRVIRDTWVQNSQVVAFKLSARQKDGKEYEIGENTLEFTKEDNESYTSYIEMKLLIEKLVLFGDLTIFCILSGNRSIATRKTEEECTKETETQDTEDELKPAKRDFEKLSRNIRGLLDTGQGSDVTVKVNDREFPVHKLILGARSPVFDKMFSHEMVEKEEGVVVITDCSPDAFKEFLLYIYSGELVEFSRKTVFDLYMLSDKYDVPDLKSASVEFIAEDLCVDNFSDVVHLALQQSESVLLEKATKFFGKNLKNIIVSAKWQSFITENPIQANELYIKALNDLLPE